MAGERGVVHPRPCRGRTAPAADRATRATARGRQRRSAWWPPLGPERAGRWLAGILPNREPRKSSPRRSPAAGGRRRRRARRRSRLAIRGHPGAHLADGQGGCRRLRSTRGTSLGAASTDRLLGEDQPSAGRGAGVQLWWRRARRGRAVVRVEVVLELLQPPVSARRLPVRAPGRAGWPGWAAGRGAVVSRSVGRLGVLRSVPELAGVEGSARGRGEGGHRLTLTSGLAIAAEHGLVDPGGVDRPARAARRPHGRGAVVSSGCVALRRHVACRSVR